MKKRYRRSKDDDEVVTAQNRGRVKRDENGVKVSWEHIDERDYEIPVGMRVLPNEGDSINAGDQLAEGSKNPHQILEIQGSDAVTQYLLREIQKVYRPQGKTSTTNISGRTIRKMLSKVIVTSSGDTECYPAELIENIFETNAG